MSLQLQKKLQLQTLLKAGSMHTPILADLLQMLVEEHGNIQVSSIDSNIKDGMEIVKIFFKDGSGSFKSHTFTIKPNKEEVNYVR